MRRALERGLPVIWIAARTRRDPRLVDPAVLHQHAEATEAMAHLAQPGRAADGRARWPGAGAAAGPAGPATPTTPEAKARRDYAEVDPMHRRPPPLGLGAGLARPHALALVQAVRAVGRRRAGAAPRRERRPPAALARAARLRATAHARRTRRPVRADHLSSIHRSEQLLLIVHRDRRGVHRRAAGADRQRTGAGQDPRCSRRRRVRRSASPPSSSPPRRAVAHRHRRWSDARRLAERLRAARATWPLGFDIADAHAAAARRPGPSGGRWRCCAPPARRAAGSTGPASTRRRRWVGRRS